MTLGVKAKPWPPGAPTRDAADRTAGLPIASGRAAGQREDRVVTSWDSASGGSGFGECASITGSLAAIDGDPCRRRLRSVDRRTGTSSPEAAVTSSRHGAR